MLRNIAFDFDEVIADTAPYKKWYTEKEMGSSFEGRPDNELKTKMYADIEASIERIKFIEGSIESLKFLINSGSNVRVVTSRSGQSLEVLKLLLEKVGINIPIYGVGYRQSKLPHLLDCYSFVDDDPRNLYELIGKVPKIFLMNSEENVEESNPNFIRIHSLTEMISSLEKDFSRFEV